MKLLVLPMYCQISHKIETASSLRESILHFKYQSKIILNYAYDDPKLNSSARTF